MNKLIKSISVFLVILFSISSVNAATLTDRLKDGHKLRLGFGTAVPWAYAGDNGEALGFVNMIALTVLEEMGITEHESIELYISEVSQGNWWYVHFKK